VKLLNSAVSHLESTILPLLAPPYKPAVLSDLARRTSVALAWGNVSEEEVGSGEVESSPSESDS
jgi:hypothetical protein